MINSSGRLATASDESSETEGHFHTIERSFGKSADQSGNDWALESSLTLFRCISGSGAYGGDANDEAKVTGTADTPMVAGNTRYDLSSFSIIDTSSTTAYHIRFVYGTGIMADAITAGQYSTKPYKRDGTQGRQPPFEIRLPRLTSGSHKIWVQCKNASDNATLDFLVTVHEYRT
jgi:hypothetical protein